MQIVLWELSRKNSHKNIEHRLHELTQIFLCAIFKVLEFVSIGAIRVKIIKLNYVKIIYRSYADWQS